MEITVKDLQKKIHLRPQALIKIVRAILRHEKVAKASLSVVFVSSQKIRALNKKFLNRTYVTDVLAFDALSDGGHTPGKRKRVTQLAGDIVICTDMALKNAAGYDTTVSRELCLYVVHGILHLLGFDDHSPSDIKRMRAREASLMRFLGSQMNDVVDEG